MSRFGYFLIGIALACGIAMRLFGFEDSWAYALFGLGVFGGVLLLAINATVRIHQRKLIVRPFDAARKAWWLFLLILTIRMAADWFWPSENYGLGNHVLQAALLAIVYSLWSTAYRKPA